MGWILLGTLTVLVAVTAAAATKALRPESMIEAVVTFGVLATGEIVLVTGLSGAVGQLDVLPVALLVVLLAIAAAAWVRLSIRPSFSPTLHRPVVNASTPRRVLRWARAHPWVSALVCLASAALAWQVLVAIVMPPYAFDGNTYRLTIAADWIQQGSVAPSSLSLCCSRYPANAELLFVWPMLLQGSDALVGLVQVGLIGLAAASVAGLARSSGLGRPDSLAASCLFICTPVVLAQAPVAYADMVIAGWGLAALHALVRFADGHDVRRLVTAGIATGLVLGTKGTGVVWATALVACALGVIVVSARRVRFSRRHAVASGAALLAGCLLFGGYWYARNWIDTGNPLSPFRVEVAGATLFDGPFELDEVTTPSPRPDDPSPVAVGRSWVEDLRFWDLSPVTYEQREGGLGPLWPWLGAPLLLGTVVHLVRRRSPAALAVGVVAAMLIVQPYNWWSRFTVQLPALGAVAVVLVTARLGRRHVAAAIRGIALVLAVLGVVTAVRAVDPAGGGRVIRADDVLRLASAPQAERTLGELFFPEYRFVDDLPPDATVVVDLRAEPVRFLYPMFGSSFERRLVALDSSDPPNDAWVVTASARPVDRRMVADGTHDLVWDERDIRVWRPRPGSEPG